MKMSFLCAAFLFASAAFASDATKSLTALDRYVAAADPNYTWKIHNKIDGDGFTTFVVDMTSQQWLTAKEVNQPLWRHWMSITVPDQVKHQSALLFIGGGSSKSAPPKGPDENLAKIALTTQSIVAELKNVPNQPLIFDGDGKERVEDDLIAYTWDKYLRTGDERWPARLPMTKSAVRAMDTITALCATSDARNLPVKSFVIAGGSKRGWTTWTTAATDKRVIAIVPIVIDLLNVIPSFKHHYAAYGFWAPAVGDYEAHGIMNWTDSPEYKELMKIEEPFEYRDRLTMPKFIVNSAGDQFFLPDSSQFYFDQLKGQKYLRYVPNSDHSLRKTDAYVSLLAFYDGILNQKSLPEFTWSAQGEGKVRVETRTRPSKVKLWQATNPDARDFRLDTLGPKYSAVDLSPEKDGVYSAQVPRPEKGWTAYFVELTFDNKPAPYTFTTEVAVTPKSLPFADKVPPATRPQGFLSGGK